MDGQTNGWTDGWMDQQTDKASDRVACPQLQRRACLISGCALVKLHCNLICNSINVSFLPSCFICSDYKCDKLWHAAPCTLINHKAEFKVRRLQIDSRPKPPNFKVILGHLRCRLWLRCALHPFLLFFLLLHHQPFLLHHLFFLLKQIFLLLLLLLLFIIPFSPLIHRRQKCWL